MKFRSMLALLVSGSWWGLALRQSEQAFWSLPSLYIFLALVFAYWSGVLYGKVETFEKVTEDANKPLEKKL